MLSKEKECKCFLRIIGKGLILCMQNIEKNNKNLAVIMAVGRDGALGINNGLIWKLPGDLPRFKRLTKGHTVIMGRNTWFSLPKRPLAGRRNIVITSDSQFSAEGAERASSLRQAIEMSAGDDMPFVIGGGMLYSEAVKVATHLFLTEVDADCSEADVRINLDFISDYQPVNEEQGVSDDGAPAFKFCDYIRRESGC